MRPWTWTELVAVPLQRRPVPGDELKLLRGRHVLLAAEPDRAESDLGEDTHFGRPSVNAAVSPNRDPPPFRHDRHPRDVHRAKWDLRQVGMTGEYDIVPNSSEQLAETQGALVDEPARRHDALRQTEQGSTRIATPAPPAPS
jgi:hypothetical protein